MTGLTKKQLEFLRVISEHPHTLTGELTITLKQSSSSVLQRLKHCEKNGLVAGTFSLGYYLTDAGKHALNGFSRNPETLAKSVERLTQAWPFHLHETMLDNGYGADIHNKYDRPVASFRNIERAKAFMAVVTELLKGSK